MPRLWPALTLAAALLPALCGGRAQAATLVGHPAPEIARADLHQTQVRLRDFRGRVVLLNFWATWCGPCRVEMPRFMQWQRQYGPRGLRVLGVSIDDSAPPVREFAAKLRVDYPIVMSDPKLGDRYGIFGVPVTFLIDRHGIIRARFDGESDPAAMERTMQKLLAAPAN